MAGSSLFASIGSAFHSAFSSPAPAFSSPSSPHRSPQLAAFNSELASQLDRLRPSSSRDSGHEDDDGITSCAWLCRCLQVVLSAHASMEAFLPDLHRALASGDTKWLDAYFDDSAKLLDICNALKDAMAGVRNYHASLDSALHCLKQGNLNDSQLRRAKIALRKCTSALARASDSGAGRQHRSKLDKCSSVLRRMGEKLGAHHTAKSNFFVASYATQITTVFICGVLTSALSARSQHRPMPTVSTCHHQCSWVFSLNSLQHRVKQHVDKKKMKGAVAPLKELEKTHTEACRLSDSIDKLLLRHEKKVDSLLTAAQHADDVWSHIRSLKLCLEDLSQGLSPLEVYVDRLRKVLIASRLALLEIYTQSRSI